MQSTREETPNDNSAYSNRCLLVCGVICITLATLFFFGSVSVIVWLVKYNYPVKFSVICFIVACGVLFLTSFTSSLLLVVNGRCSRINSSEESMGGFTQSERAQESYEMTTNISYGENPNLLQLPQSVITRDTPPPPYHSSTNGSTSEDNTISENEMGEVPFTIQTLHKDGLTTDRVYYDLEGNLGETLLHRNEKSRVTLRPINNDAIFQEQISPLLIASLDKSPSISHKIVQQRASNSQFMQQDQTKINVPQSSFRDQQHGFLQASVDSERSPRQAQSVKRKPSTAMKRNMETVMSMSQSDSDSGTRTSSSNSNVVMSIPHSYFNLDENSQMAPSKWNAKVQTSHSNLNINESLQVSKSNWNAKKTISQSNLNPETTPRFLRRNAEVRTSHLNLKPAVLSRAAPSSLNIEECSLNSNPESKNPESLSNSGRQQFATKSNYILPKDRLFTSNFNLNMNPDEQSLASHSNSEALHCPSQLHTDSNLPLASLRSNISNIGTKLQVQNLKIYHPEQFVARSKEAPGIHKAQSFGSLTANASKLPELGTEPKTVGRGDASSNTYHESCVSGRSAESVLEASNSKQMSPQEWLSAWNRGFHKLRTTDAEGTVGVRL